MGSSVYRNVRSSYWQRLGILKEEQSDIDLTFIDEPANGFVGGMAGICNTSTGAELVTSDFHLKITHPGGSQQIQIRKTNLGWTARISGRMVSPGGGVSSTTASGSPATLTFNMTTAGVYRFYLTENFEQNNYTAGAIPNSSWTARRPNMSGPAEFTASRKPNAYLTRLSHFYNPGVGPSNPFAYVVDAIDELSCVGSFTYVGSLQSVTNTAFVGTTTAVGPYKVLYSGYWSSTSGQSNALFNSANFHVNGIAVAGAPLTVALQHS